MGVVRTTEQDSPESPRPAEGAADAGPGAADAGPGAAGVRAPRRGLYQTVGDMVRSLAVILGIVAVLVLIVPRPNEIAQPPVNVAEVAAGAEGSLSFRPAVPGGLPDGWSPRTATVQDGTDDVPMWLVQYRTPRGDYAGLRQAANATPAWENRQVTDGREQGTVRVAGHDWVVRSRADRGITSWVLRQDGITTVITGTANEAELTTLAESLGLPPA
jgi:hypothetical protein